MGEMIETLWTCSLCPTFSNTDAGVILVIHLSQEDHLKIPSMVSATDGGTPEIVSKSMPTIIIKFAMSVCNMKMLSLVSQTHLKTKSIMKLCATTPKSVNIQMLIPKNALLKTALTMPTSFELFHPYGFQPLELI